MLARVREGDGGVRATTGDVNRARLRELGFELGARADAGVTDETWFATAPDGAGSAEERAGHQVRILDSARLLRPLERRRAA